MNQRTLPPIAVPAQRQPAPEPDPAAPAATPDAAQLTFRQTVPRQLVHRAAVAEVFVVDALQAGQDHFLIGAQWPRDHALYHPDEAGSTDPLLFAETIRQSMVYLAHQFQGVPLEHRFIGCDCQFDIHDAEPLRVLGQPLTPVLEARWTWLDSRPPQRYDMRLDVQLTVGGKACGVGSLHLFTVDQRRYDLIRRRGRDGRGGAKGGSVAAGAGVSGESGPRKDVTFIRVPAAAAGRLRTKDSLLERDEESDRWRMRVDVNHAILFDHPSDHIPLMVALEGFRQLGHVLTQRTSGGEPGAALSAVSASVPAAAPAAVPAAGMSLRSVQLECLAFGEVDEPVDLVVDENRPGAAPDSAHLLRLSALQQGRPIAKTTMLWRPDAQFDPEYR